MDADTYSKLIDIQKRFPDLTFDNNGYEYLSKEVRQTHEKVITELRSLLKESIEGFEEFYNFKPRKDGSFAVRVRYAWSNMFSGVGYFDISDFKETHYKYTPGGGVEEVTK